MTKNGEESARKPDALERNKGGKVDLTSKWLYVGILW